MKKEQLMMILWAVAAVGAGTLAWRTIVGPALPASLLGTKSTL